MKHIYLACVVVLLLSLRCIGQSQSDSTKINTDVKSRIDHLRSRLHWSDESGHKQFAANSVQVTNQLWANIDSFIAQTYNSGNVSPKQLKSTLDSMLGHSSNDLENTLIFPVDIPAGKFVIVGLEVARGGGAVPEDAISFRAYGRANGRWTLVGHVEFDPEDHFLVDVNALPLSEGLLGNFGLIAWSVEPPLAPYKVLARVYAFDGQNFMTVWAPHAFITGNVPSFVSLTSTGFDLHVLTPDRTAEILKSYTVVSGEVIKSTEVDMGPRR